MQVALPVRGNAACWPRRGLVERAVAAPRTAAAQATTVIVAGRSWCRVRFAAG